jgi:SAM-dependent methyltransferase
VIRTGPPWVRSAVSALHRWLYRGQCNVCGHEGPFRIRPEARANLRETLDCPACRSISRDRFMAAVMARCLGLPPLMAEWPEDRSLLVREPSAFRGRAEMLDRKVTYRPFRFPAETLEALGDTDRSLDHVIAADVFEHVRLDDRAFREVYRVLKPGGYFFLQVPYRHGQKTEILVAPDGDCDRYLAPPQYHDEDTLVYRIYGRDLLPRLEGLGFRAGYVRCRIRPWGIVMQDMIVCRKDAPLDTTPRLGVRFDERWRR